jgi:hypothetical protein
MSDLVFNARLVNCYLARDGRSTVYIFYVPSWKKGSNIYKLVCGSTALLPAPADSTYKLSGWRRGSSIDYCQSVSIVE